jgi:hypothetical protein
VHLVGFLFIVVIADARNHEPEIKSDVKIRFPYTIYLFIFNDYYTDTQFIFLCTITRYNMEMNCLVDRQ